MKNTIETNISNCTRCGKDHKGITFKKFVHPIYDNQDIEWNYWAHCPNNGDPILLRILEESGQE
jgi:hypothetical protein